MTGTELRDRVDKLGVTYGEAAERLGLSLAGLNHQMRGIRPVGRQTEIILDCLEHHLSPAIFDQSGPTRNLRPRGGAQHAGRNSLKRGGDPMASSDEVRSQDADHRGGLR
jgi:hypothetical protein